MSRAAALAGIGSVACFAAAVGLYGSGAGSSRTEIVAYYAHHADRLRQLAGFGVLLAGIVLFACFVAGLHALVRAGPAAPLVLLGGAATAVLLAAADALWAATAYAAQREPGYVPDAASHLLVEDAAFLLVVTAMATAALLVLAASAAARATGALPRWFAVAGLPVAAALGAAWLGIPALAFPLWILCASVLLLRLPD